MNKADYWASQKAAAAAEIAQTKAIDAQLAQQSQIKPQSDAALAHQMELVKEAAKAQAKTDRWLEIQKAYAEPVKPGTMKPRASELPIHYGRPCAVRGCTQLSTGSFGTAQPKDAFPDPFLNPPAPLDDDTWIEQALSDEEEIRLRAMGASSNLVDQIEAAQRMMRSVPKATLAPRQVVEFPLCESHANGEGAREAGIDTNYITPRNGR